MNERVRAIVEEARKLTPQKRRELFDLLEVEFSSDQDRTPEEIDSAQLDEVKRRLAQVERGEVELVDFEEVMTRARRLIR